MDFDNTSHKKLKLDLGLGLSLHDQSSEEYCMKKKMENQQKCNNIKDYYPSLTLGLPKGDEVSYNQHASKTSDDSYESSYSNSSSIKREIDNHVLGGEEFEVEIEKVLTKMGDIDEDGNNPRKKLRLTKEQSGVLEENFREHSTLNPKQKQELAIKLNLRARQVEVWFQNRRARTKHKQTETDYEFLKKCCETLSEENTKLQKELQELKSKQNTIQATSFYMQIPASAATLNICPSCERIYNYHALPHPSSAAC